MTNSMNEDISTPSEPSSPSYDNTDAGMNTGTIPFPIDHRPALRFRVGRLIISQSDGTRFERTIDLPHVRIGSAPKNDVIIADPSVSRYHCEMRHSEQGFCIRDLGSTNGTVI